MKKQKPEPLEREIVQHSDDNPHSQKLISVNMKGFASNETELKLNALKLLISRMDVDDACGGDLSVFEMLMDQLLLSAAEQLGAEGWYDFLPEELLPYNPDTNEMEISEPVNWLLLKQYVDGKVTQLLEKKPTEH